MSVPDKTKGHRRIPRFKSYEEEADFWDTHSPEDFPEEFEEIKVEFAEPVLVTGELEVEQYERLIEVWSRLSDAQRLVLCLDSCSLSAAEAAAMLGWTSERYLSVLSEARKRIRSLVRNLAEEPSHRLRR